MDMLDEDSKHFVRKQNQQTDDDENVISVSMVWGSKSDETQPVKQTREIS